MLAGHDREMLSIGRPVRKEDLGRIRRQPELIGAVRRPRSPKLFIDVRPCDPNTIVGVFDAVGIREKRTRCLKVVLLFVELLKTGGRLQADEVDARAVMRGNR